MALDGYSYSKEITITGSGDGEMTDYPLKIRVIKTHNFFDRCESTDGWTGANLDSVNYVEGSGSLYDIASTGQVAIFYRSSDTPEINAFCTEANGYFHISIRVSVAANLGAAGVVVEISSSGTYDNDEYSWTIPKESFEDGWNEFNLKISEADKVGTPDLTAINFFRIFTMTVTGNIQLNADSLYFYESSVDQLAGLAVRCSSCQDDFDDVRFTGSDGETLLDQWRETYVSGQYADYWVEFPTIPQSPSTATFYIFYENAGASLSSDGGATFVFFDDFSGDLSKWDDMPGSWEIDAGRLKGDTGDSALALVANMNSMVFEAIINKATDANNCRICLNNDDESVYNHLWLSFGGNDAQFLKTGETGSWQIHPALAANTDYKLAMKKVGTDFYLYIDDELLQSNAGWLTITFTKIGVKSEAADVVYWDNVLVRLYTPDEPVITAWGAATSSGWSAGSVCGVSNPASVAGVAAEDIANIMGVS